MKNQKNLTEQKWTVKTISEIKDDRRKPLSASDFLVQSHLVGVLETRTMKYIYPDTPIKNTRSE